MWDIKTCCRKLFLYPTYSSFSNAASAKVGVARKDATANSLYLAYPSFSNVVSA